MPSSIRTSSLGDDNSRAMAVEKPGGKVSPLLPGPTTFTLTLVVI